MEKLVAQFPKHIADAIVIAKESSFDQISSKDYSNIVVCGMGGSGIGGKLVAKWFENEAKVPIVLVQEYAVPAFVGKNSLVIGSSYSGNTEETMSAIKHAHSKGATICGITSGGELFKFCKENNYEVVKVPGGNPPRAMLAFSVVQLINILAKANIISKESLEKVDRCRHLLNKELIEIKDKARSLAEFAYKKQLITYSSASNEAIALRCRQQINENAKQLSSHNVIPEMNHNELVGWAGGSDDFATLFLSSQFLSERVKLRFEINKKIIGDKTPHIMELVPKGDSEIEETFYLIHIIDWASVYLAEKNKVDVVEVKVIDYLKGELSKA